MSRRTSRPWATPLEAIRERVQSGERVRLISGGAEAARVAV